MIPSELLIGLLWIAWLIYWLLSATRAKRSKRRYNWHFDIGLRLFIFAIIILFLKVPVLYNLVINAHYKSFYSNPYIISIGFLIAVVGFAFSIWARISLGKNWGMPRTLKEKPELVTAGPYKYVRHPIYTGVITAMAGTVLVATPFWIFPIIVFSAYFIYSAKKEEKDMLEQFPKEYREYKKNTKFLIPYII